MRRRWRGRRRLRSAAEGAGQRGGEQAGQRGGGEQAGEEAGERVQGLAGIAYAQVLKRPEVTVEGLWPELVG